MFDLHVHSNNSFDAKETIEAICIEAIHKGIEHLTFAEHLCYNPKRKTYGYMDFKRYNEEFNEAKMKYKDLINIYMGVEICEPHILVEKYKENLKDIELDVILGSIHNIGARGLRALVSELPSDEGYSLYFENLYEMVCTADFDVAAHIDLLNRYAYKTIGTYDFKDNEETIRDILKKIIERDKGVEINTSVFRKAPGNMENSIKVFKIYKELGGKIITLGSDSHKLEDLGAYCKESRDILKSIGFKNIYIYEKRKPKGIKL